jgi:hypothetical protein
MLTGGIWHAEYCTENNITRTTTHTPTQTRQLSIRFCDPLSWPCNAYHQLAFQAHAKPGVA